MNSIKNGNNLTIINFKKMKKIILLASLAFSINAFAQIPTNGLIGYWSFTGNANDLSGNNNNGTVTGATLTNDRFGNANSAYSFNGTTNFINISNSTVLNPSTEITISVWVQSTASHGNSGIIGKWNNFNGSIGSGQEQYVMMANGQGINFITKTSTQKTVTESNVIYNDGNWHHYIGIWNGSTMKLYRDGIFLSTTNQTGTIPSFTQGLEIGRYAGGQGTGANQNYFNGKIDDLRLYNVAIDSTGITALYNEGVCYQNITVTDTLLINTTITGFNPITYQNTIKVYPNPTNDHITIDNGNIANLAGYQIKITNSLSQQVFQSAITQQQFYVDLSTWTGNGIYFVHIIDGQGNTIDIKKIVLQ